MNAADLTTRTVRAGTFGTLCFDKFPFTLANGDNIASTHDIFIFPEGIEFVDAALWVSDAGPASTTLDIGLKSVSGTNQDDPDYFFAVVAAAATGFTRKTANTEPLVTAQSMYLRVTVQGANQNGAFAGTVGVWYKNNGPA